MKALAAVGLIAYLATHAAWAECVEPHAPHVPDGATAAREDMLSALDALKAYKTGVEDYAKCLQSSGVGDRFKADRARDTLVVIADKFNAELREFRKKNSA